MRDQVIKEILKHRLIVIIRGVDRERLIPLAQALYEGGVRLLELTFCADGRVSDEDTAESIRLLARAFAGRMRVGAGTVLTEQQAVLAADAGAEFIISPDTCVPVIERTRALGMVSIPGALTPSEIRLAHSAGADFVKLFPVSAMGAAYVKAITAPLSHVRLLAVGGIDESTVGEYARAGASAFGVGGCLVDRELIEREDFSSIAARARRYTQEVEKWYTI